MTPNRAANIDIGRVQVFSVIENPEKLVSREVL